MNIILDNISRNHRQASWVTMGLPNSLPKTFGKVKQIGDPSREFDAIIDGYEMFVNADLNPGERFSGTFLEDSSQNISYKLSNTILDRIQDLILDFYVNTSDNTTTYKSLPLVFDPNKSLPAFICIDKDQDVRKRLYFKTKIVEVSMIIEGWIDLFHNQSTAPIIIRASFGTTGNAGIPTSLGSFYVTLGEKLVIDYAKKKGLHNQILLTDNKWQVELSIPRAWSRASVIELTGCLVTKLGQWNLNDTTPELAARLEGPLCGMVDDWDGKYLAFKTVPQRPNNAATISSSRKSGMYTSLNTTGDEYNNRPFGQPKNSGQTGEQPDFGASKCEEIVSMKNPWAIYDLRWSAQAWMLRPYTNREPDGSRVMAVNHPNARTYNLRPDERFSSRDMLGWPNPVPYSWPGSGFSTSDSQHRSDNLLYGLYVLTRDPSLELLIKDMIELEKMALKTGDVGTVGSPRGWGRPLIALCHAYAAGFTEVRSIIEDKIRFLYRNASYKKLPNDPSLTIKVLADNESKYGWTTPDRKAIRAWLPWQEAIAVMGLWAAWKQLGSLEAKELALEVSKTITNHAFFTAPDGKWYCCYAVRWRTDVPGLPLPASSYNTATPNYDVFVYGIHRWVLPAVYILRSSNADPALQNRINTIINYYGAVPKDWTDSGWWAV